MYPIRVPSESVLRAMAALDRQIAQDTRALGCPWCGARLHSAPWRRKPRGAPDLPDHCYVRWGLCCGTCRKRVLPPSVLFCGRYVYLKAVVLLVVAARQRVLSRPSMSRLQRLFGVSRDTIVRWLAAFLDRLPVAPAWWRVRGRLPASISDVDVPAALLDVLLEEDPDPDRVLVLACQLVPAL